MVICRFKMYFAAILPEQQVKMLFLKDSVIISYLLLMNTLLISVTCYQMCGPAHGRMLESMNLHLVSVLVIGLIYWCEVEPMRYALIINEVQGHAKQKKCCYFAVHLGKKRRVQQKRWISVQKHATCSSVCVYMYLCTNYICCPWLMTFVLTCQKIYGECYTSLPKFVDCCAGLICHHQEALNRSTRWCNRIKIRHCWGSLKRVNWVIQQDQNQSLARCHSTTKIEWERRGLRCWENVRSPWLSTSTSDKLLLKELLNKPIEHQALQKMHYCMSTGKSESVN